MTGCSNRRCDGGWITVLPDYADQHMPRPQPDVWDAMDAAARNKWEEDHAATRAALESTVYPCEQCQPDLFYRWIEGHLDVHHNRSACSVCSGTKAERRRGHHGPTEPVGIQIPDPTLARRGAS